MHHSRQFSSAAVCLPAALLAALLATFLYAGILDPHNTQWMLQEGDLLQHFLGWHFFRSEPWGWPLGAIQSYGTGLKSSIVFTDSLPLLALPLKLISRWLPDIFQYQGLMIWLHTVLNAMIAALLLHRLRVNVAAAVMAGLMLAFLPAVLFRGPGGAGHEALMAHWVVLAGMYLLLFLPRATLVARGRWCALLVVATLVHFYLFVMAAALWSVWWLIQTRELHRLHCRQRYVWSRWLLYSAAQPLLILLVMWAAGYLHSAGAGDSGYGFYSAELAAYANPRSYVSAMPSFSAFVARWGTGIAGQYEGVAYVGAGIMALWSVAFVVLTWRVCRRCDRDLLQIQTHSRVSIAAKGLALLCMGAFLYALGDPITLGNYSVGLPIGWPTPLRELLRASGRFNWLLMYGMTLAALWMLARWLNPRRITALVAALALLQFADLAPWYGYLHGYTQRAGAYTLATDSELQAFNSPVLDEALSQKHALHVVPAKDIVGALPLAWLAGMHDLEINAAYTARVSADDISRATAPAAAALARQNLDPDVLYAMTTDTWTPDVCALTTVTCVQAPIATFVWRHDTN